MARVARHGYVRGWNEVVLRRNVDRAFGAARIRLGDGVEVVIHDLNRARGDSSVYAHNDDSFSRELRNRVSLIELSDECGCTFAHGGVFDGRVRTVTDGIVQNLKIRRQHRNAIAIEVCQTRIFNDHSGDRRTTGINILSFKILNNDRVDSDICKTGAVIPHVNTLVGDVPSVGALRRISEIHVEGVSVGHSIEMKVRNRDVRNRFSGQAIRSTVVSDREAETSNIAGRAVEGDLSGIGAISAPAKKIRLWCTADEGDVV